MLTVEGPKVVEFNCRFGDPECQALMVRAPGDLVPLLLASAQGTRGRRLARGRARLRSV